MELFAIVPGNFFGILSSKNKHIYIHALLVLRECFKDSLRISKDDFILALIEKLENEIMSYDFDEEIIQLKEVNYSSIAHLIVRKFVETGWIEVEYLDNSFDEFIAIPDYAIKIINVLYGIIYNEIDTEYNTYVFSTFSTLRLADVEGKDYYTAILSASKATEELDDKLKMFLNNIKRYHRQLSNNNDLNQLLDEHFNEFIDAISDKIYYPLKTLDSVPRFKTPIIKILNKWMVDDEILSLMVQESLARKKYVHEDEAYESLIGMIGRIIDIYERLDELLRVIDNKKAAYTKATVEKIEYLLNTDTSLKGKIKNIIKVYQGLDEEDPKYDRVEDMIQGRIELFPQSNLTEDSLYNRKKKDINKTANRLKIRKSLDDQIIDNELHQFRDHIKESFSNQKVLKFIESQLGQKDKIHSKELSVEEDKDFILTILGTMKHDDKKSFYKLKFNDGYIDNNGYRLPDFTIKKK